MDLKLTQGMKKRILAILMILCIVITGIVSGVLFKVSVIDSKELSAMLSYHRATLKKTSLRTVSLYARG